MNTPDQANAEIGRSAWKCWGCKAESGLHWWNGLSVAVCNRPECSKAYCDFLTAQVQEQERFDAYVREYMGE